MTAEYCLYVGLNDSLISRGDNDVRSGFILNVQPGFISGFLL